MKNLKSLIINVNFLLGLVLGALLTWVLFIREPFLSTPEEKGSYAYGQQMGRNLKNGFIEYDSRIVRMGMDHASRDVSKLETKEIQESLNYLSQKSMPLRRQALAKQAPAPSLVSGVEESGFTRTSFRFSYLKSSWEDYQQIKKSENPPGELNREEMQSPVEFNQMSMDTRMKVEFELQYHQLNSNENSPLASSQKYNVESQDLPESLRIILSAMKAKETWLVKLNSAPEPTLKFQWPLGFSESTIIEIKRY
ncbi:MAG: FKBP-type peptidyl-prolyl cis-trans isomerase N-terminal domain-containing protein [Bdellovibrionales bacterium]